MKKKIPQYFSWLAAIIICLLFSLAGCTAAKSEGFAIYLTKDDVPPAQMAALSHVDIAEAPVISLTDIIYYNAQTHELKLTAAAFARLASLEVPVRGRSFLVCIDKRPVYGGAFWTPVSSISYDGVTIWKPFNATGPQIITLELGYPSSSFYGGQDPRGNAEVMKSLEGAGKLINKQSIASIDNLPNSMKGYELYSWLENGQWRFTLITGTNRNKTRAEITSPEDYISESGWVKVTAAGLEDVRAVLSKLPPNESIFWLDGMREQTDQTGIKIQLPPQEISGAVKQYAVQYGLQLNIN
jgi:hypothetical protein